MLKIKLTLTRPIGLPPHMFVAQKIADQRWLIRQKKGTFLYEMMRLKDGQCEKRGQLGPI